MIQTSSTRWVSPWLLARISHKPLLARRKERRSRGLEVVCWRIWVKGVGNSVFWERSCWPCLPYEVYGVAETPVQRLTQRLRWC